MAQIPSDPVDALVGGISKPGMGIFFQNIKDRNDQIFPDVRIYLRSVEGRSLSVYWRVDIFCLVLHKLGLAACIRSVGREEGKTDIE